MLFFILLFFVSLLYAQESDSSSTTGITDQRQRLLVLPVREQQDKRAQEINSLCLSILADEAINLKRFEILDRNNLDLILAEQSTQWSGIVDENTAVEMGKIMGAEEALVLEIRSISQQGVPPEARKEDNSLIGNIIENIIFKDVEKYPNNIETSLQLNLTKLDLKTGKSLENYSYRGQHTGGTSSESLQQVLNDFRLKIRIELRKLFLLRSHIAAKEDGELILPLGRNMGLAEGMIFTIALPDRTRQIGGKSIEIPGKNIALVKVSTVSEKSHIAVPVRQWGDIPISAEAVEHVDHIFSFELGGILPSKLGDINSSSWSTLFLMNFNPFGSVEGGFGLKFGQFVDSRQETSADFGLALFLGAPIRLSRNTTLSLRASIDMDGALRGDNDNHNVAAFVFSVPVEALVRLQLSPKWNTFAGTGYRLGGTASSWQYTEDDQSHPAVWDTSRNPAPIIDNSGVYLRLGFEYFVF